MKTAESLLKLFNIRALKAYGQNFLADENILDEICQAAEISKTDFVIEIGPGIGTLTQRLCEKAGFVAAVEIDRRMKAPLDFVLSGYSTCEIIYADILRVDIENDLINKYKKLEFKSVKIVANLPYYIASAVIMRLVSLGSKFSDIVVMVQKEVAERICSHPGGKEYGVLSIMVQSQAAPSILMNVPGQSFIPSPKVDSAVISVKPLLKPIYSENSETFFIRTVKAAFSQRRKTILNSLSGGLGREISKEQLTQVLSQSGIDPGARAETIPVDVFVTLAENLMLLF